MTHPVEAQIDLEAKLLKQTTDIAGLLSAPLSQDRTEKIAEIWQHIARSYGPYQRDQAAVRAHTTNINDPPMPPKSIEARADFLRHAAHRASLWDKIATLLERQTEIVQTPLVDTRHVRAVTRQDDLLSYLTNALHNLANPIAYNSDHARENQFLDIALSGGHFINLIHAAYRIALAQGRSGPLRFIDVGCGGGSKVIMASHFFEQADGLEYNTNFVEHAQSTIEVSKAEGCTIQEGDALTFRDYADYDIIYFYRPISDNDILTQMEATIVDMVKPGTIIIAPMGFQKPGAFTNRITSIAANVYLTQTSVEDTAKIRTRAEAIGPDWQLHNPTVAKGAGFWLPIIQASRANGYCLPR
jgi:protein-L-isoaspartate O-methyltransferase